MFERNLQDLIRGIRSHSDDESKFVALCMDECRKELKQSDLDMKAIAVAKLTYLQMIGYDVSWASFHILEVMTSKKFYHKRIGYLAASQCYRPTTDILIMTTNLVRRDILSDNQYEAGTALSSVASFLTPDLARDIANDLVTRLSAAKPYVRKKATLMTYKLFLSYPEALRPTFPRLKERLEDQDAGVQAVAVNVICELARRNPQNYLSLAPVFFKILTSSSNNWMRIKILKLFAALCPLEPRLAKKLIEPLTNLIQSTPAMSVLYECINTIVTGIPDHQPSIELCVQKLRLFVDDQDQNLKYLGLLALANVLKLNPKAVAAHKEVVLQCIDDQDESIRLRALDLLAGMVSKKNLLDIVRKLVSHLESTEGQSYRDEVVAKIIHICSQDKYKFITNFDWYISVLVQLTRVEGTRHGALIASQLLDIPIRVKVIRPNAVAQMAALLDNPLLLSGSQSSNVSEVLHAAAWVVGEFSEYLTTPEPVLQAMLQPRVTALPGHIQAVYVQSVLKIFSNLVNRTGEASVDPAVISRITTLLTTQLPLFIQSGDLEVQERAVFAVELLKIVTESVANGAPLYAELATLFEGELNPVHASAIEHVPIPEGLNLDEWIHAPPPEPTFDVKKGDIFFFDDPNTSTKSFFDEPSKPEPVSTPSESAAKRASRNENNPFYLPQGESVKRTYSPTNEGALDVDAIPIQKLDTTVPLSVDLFAEQPGKKGKKGKKGKRDKEPAEDVHFEISTVDELPEGVVLQAPKKKQETIFDRLNMNVDAPLDPSEKLPTSSHRVVPAAKAPTTEEAKKKKKKQEKESKQEDKPKKKHHHDATPASTPAPVVTPVAAPVAVSTPTAEVSKKDKKDKKSKHSKHHHGHHDEAEASVALDIHQNVKEYSAAPAQSAVAASFANVSSNVLDIDSWLNDGPLSPNANAAATVAAANAAKSVSASASASQSKATSDDDEDNKKHKKEKKEKKAKKSSKE